MEGEEIELAPEAGLEVVQPDEGQDEATTDAAEVAPEDEKTRTQKRRERERATRERLIADKAAAEEAARAAQERHRRIVEAGKSETQPTADEYPDPIEHAAALAVWKQTSRGLTREASTAEAEAQAAQDRVTAAQHKQDAELGKIWAEHVTEAKGRYADFEAVVMRQDVPINADMAREIMRADEPADLAYALCKDPALLSRLSSLNAVDRARELGRIEASLSAPKPRTATKAPDPISPVRGGSSSVKSPERMSFSEYEAARKAGQIT